MKSFLICKSYDFETILLLLYIGPKLFVFGAFLLNILLYLFEVLELHLENTLLIILKNLFIQILFKLISFFIVFKSNFGVIDFCGYFIFEDFFYSKFILLTLHFSFWDFSLIDRGFSLFDFLHNFIPPT